MAGRSRTELASGVLNLKIRMAFALPWLAAGLFVTVVFSPVYLEEYGYTDDYIYLQSAWDGWMPLGWDHISRQGRPLTALLLVPALESSDEIRDLSKIRGAAVALTILFVWTLGLLFYNAGIPPWLALGGAVLAVLSPGWAVWMGWTACAPYASGALMALLAGWFGWQSAGTGQWGAGLWGAGLVRACAALVLLVAALAVYQPVLGFFFIPGILGVVREGRRSTPRLVSITVLSVLGCVAYLLGFRLVQNWLGWAEDGLDRSALGFDPLPKMISFFSDVMFPLVLGWRAVFNEAWGAGLAAFSVAGLIGSVLILRRSLGTVLWAGSFLVVALVIAVAPMMAPAEPYLPFRTISGPWAMVASFVVASLAQWRGRGKLAMIAALLTVNGSAAFLAVKFGIVGPQERELKAVRVAVEKVGIHRNAILFRRPDDSATLALTGRVGAHEYWLLSSRHAWVPSAMINLLAAEMRENQSRLPYRDEMHRERIKVPVIDGNHLADSRGFSVVDMTEVLTGRSTEDLVVQKSGTTRESSAVGVFDQLDNLNWCFSPAMGYFRSSPVIAGDEKPQMNHIVLGRIYFRSSNGERSIWRNKKGDRFIFSERLYPEAKRISGDKTERVSLVYSGLDLAESPLESEELQNP